MKTITELMAKWPTDADFSRDIGISPNHGQMIKLRNSLPAKRWSAVIKAAKKRKIKGITNSSLAKLIPSK